MRNVTETIQGCLCMENVRNLEGTQEGVCVKSTIDKNRGVCTGRNRFRIRASLYIVLKMMMEASVRDVAESDVNLLCKQYCRQ